VEADGTGATVEEPVNPQDRAREALLMGLRLTEGIEFARFEARTGGRLMDAVDTGVLQAAVEAGYLVQTRARLTATAEGRKRLDALLPELAR
jgi:coproporphyrinogen III oxidase-like Fe-S oxidoreductase